VSYIPKSYPDLISSIEPSEKPQDAASAVVNSTAEVIAESAASSAPQQPEPTPSQTPIIVSSSVAPPSTESKQQETKSTEQPAVKAHVDLVQVCPHTLVEDLSSISGLLLVQISA
jgi:hypothetical protein